MIIPRHVNEPYYRKPMVGKLESGQLFEMGGEVYMALGVDLAGRQWRPDGCGVQRACAMLSGHVAFIHPEAWVDKLVVLNGKLEYSQGEGFPDETQ